MNEYPKVRYGEWAGSPNGYPYAPNRCAEEVSPKDIFRFFQCSRKRGHGLDGLFCKQHAKRHPEEK